jgi:hypothetical protein
MHSKWFASHFVGICLLGLLTIANSGCGLIFSHAPPEGYEEMDHFTCTESNAGPIIDVVWGSLNVLGALVAASNPDEYESSTVVVGLSWGVVSSISAGVGFNKSKKCRAAKQEVAARHAEERGPEEAEEVVEPVVPPVIQVVVVSPTADTLAIDEQLQLGAIAYSPSGGILTDRSFTWSSSNDAIASVSNGGLVTAHASGTVVIAANTGNVVGTASIVVTPPR